VIQLHDGSIVKDDRNPQHKVTESVGQLSGV